MIRFKEMGNITELMYTNKLNNSISIKKLDSNFYVDLLTGEIKEYIHSENRSSTLSALNAVRVSLGKLRDLINTNVTDVTFCKWITLTYAENMTDEKRLYKDFEKFMKRLKYKYPCSYIMCPEPQGRGAWHCHLLLIFDNKSPYINNNEMAAIWGHGFTKTKKLDDIDNIGAYLTAYLGDMELEEYKSIGGSGDGLDRNTKEMADGKRYVKGGRLHLYPVGFNMYRCSRDVKRPIVTRITEKNAQKKISAETLTFERTIRLTDDNLQFDKTINYRYYNSRRDNSQ